jgi:serine phosphatase RsbU (regulator of sigma subunit)
MLLDGQRLDQRPESALTTLAVAVIDCRTGEALFVAGGSEPPLVVRAESGAAEEVEVRGSLLGMDGEAKYETVRVCLGAGDLVFLTTDGTTEARSRKTREFFGYDGVTEAVRQVALGSRATVEGTAREIIQRAKEFAGGVLTDDSCVLVARFTGQADGGENSSRRAGQEQEQVA